MYEIVMNEDFVSFELAKKLKEKGFDRACIYAYCEKGGWNMYKQEHEPITHILRTDGNPFGAYYTGDNWNKEYKSNKNKIRCSAPTISQVLKWLREEKAISVEPYASASGWRVTICRAYHQDRCDAGGGTCLKEEVIGYNDGGAFEKYEEAAIAGIEYCLDNSI